MATVPKFALYGNDAMPSWLDMVHFERIPERSSLFDWEISPHVHDGLLQLLFVTAGGGQTFIDEHRWAIEPPCLVVVPAGSVHGFHFLPSVDGVVVTAAQRPLETAAAAVAPELLVHVRTPAVTPVDPHSHAGVALMPLFDALARESQTPASGQLAAGMSLLTALFVQVARLRELMRIDRGDPRSRKAIQLRRFRALVDGGFRRRLPVEHYAQELGMTAGHLGRLCREILGVAPNDVINARVLREAQRELVYSSLSIKQIAATLGFADEAYFGRFFRKQTGLRPTEFREAARGQLAHPEAATGSAASPVS